MVDDEKFKFSDLVQDIKPKDDKGLNPLEAIKMINELIQNIKSLQPKQEPIQPVITQQNNPIPTENKNIKEAEKMILDKNKAFDKILKGLGMALNIYGKDITAEEFVKKLEADKENILKML